MKTLSVQLLAVLALLALARAASAWAESAYLADYFSQFRCEGDCGEESDCPYCNPRQSVFDGR